MEQLFNAIYKKISMDYFNKDRVFAIFTFRIPKKLRKVLDIDYVQKGIESWLYWCDIKITRTQKTLKIELSW